jgi:hypothetical protein
MMRDAKITNIWERQIQRIVISRTLGV